MHAICAFLHTDTHLDLSYTHSHTQTHTHVRAQGQAGFAGCLGGVNEEVWTINVMWTQLLDIITRLTVRSTAAGDGTPLQTRGDAQAPVGLCYTSTSLCDY